MIKKDILLNLLNWLSKYTVLEWLFIDVSIVRTHHRGIGATLSCDEPIDKR